MCNLSGEALSPLTAKGDNSCRKNLDIRRINLHSIKMRWETFIQSKINPLASVALAHMPEKSMDGSGE